MHVSAAKSLIVRILGLSALCCLYTCGIMAAQSEPVLDIPRLKQITIDGSVEDWGNQGYRVNVMIPHDGTALRNVDNFDPTFRMGWTPDGLAMLFQVRDDLVREADSIVNMWMRDGIELDVARARGSSDTYQVYLGTSGDPRFPQVRHHLYDHRADAATRPALTVQASGKPVEGGYLVEALLPWSNFGITPNVGEEFALQVWIYDVDRDTDSWYRCAWYPQGLAYMDSTHSYTIRLAKNAAPPMQVVAAPQTIRGMLTRLTVEGDATCVGKRIRIRSGDRVLLDDTLVVGADGRAITRSSIPLPLLGQSYGRFTATVNGKPIGILSGEAGISHTRYQNFVDAPMLFEPFIFDGPTLPKCEFDRPQLIESMIGPYTLTVTYYNSDYQVVNQADKPGRYGAVVEIIPLKGRTTRRFCTLFRQPSPVYWWESTLPMTVELPVELGIDPTVTREKQQQLAEFLTQQMAQGFNRDMQSAIFLAWLYESVPGETVTPFSDAYAKDRQWWVGLKRKLYGQDVSYAAPFVCPRPIAGVPATVLHEGTLAEAGMRPDAVEKIDAVCQRWAADSDEAFAICVARHGVIVIHQAYGMRNGAPMTVDTPSRMASITKILSGSAVMMLVDQGRLSLDEPIATYLPPFRTAKTNAPVTLRHLYTHSWGFPNGDHWGDDLVDLEERVADYAPQLQVGKFYMYNGVGMALGGKMLEAVSGESLPSFMKQHLFEPLGCPLTTATTASYDAKSVPMDMAKIGQMLLNKGAYGTMRFFREDTLEAMLPQNNLRRILGDKIEDDYGIGTILFEDEGFAKGTFGHTAASSAILRIDPVNDLVVVMTRNAPGTNYNTYLPEFFTAIQSSMLLHGE